MDSYPLGIAKSLKCGTSCAFVFWAIDPHLDLVEICISDRKANGHGTNWSDAIKLFGKGDFNPMNLLRVLRDKHLKGPVILRAFDLMRKPGGRWSRSFELHRKTAVKLKWSARGAFPDRADGSEIPVVSIGTRSAR